VVVVWFVLSVLSMFLIMGNGLVFGVVLVSVIVVGWFVNELNF